MEEILLPYYDWFRAFHIISAVAWMAGMLYLPRLFVYHAGSEPGSDTSETFKTMERKLLRIIMNPAMISTWVFGLLMLGSNPDMLEDSWMHVKIGAVILMSGVHGLFSSWRKVFESDANLRPPDFYRWWNEVPTLLMIVIIIMAVVQPF